MVKLLRSAPVNGTKPNEMRPLDAIKQPCEVIQPNELCCAGGGFAVNANGDGEDFELDEAARHPPLRLLHLITAKVKGEESQTPQPPSCFSPLRLCSLHSPPLSPNRSTTTCSCRAARRHHETDYIRS